MNKDNKNVSAPFDVVIVGAGFSGLYLLDRVRDLGFKVRLFEGGDGLGGVWHWNCYPGARVDSNVGYYQLELKDLWRDWDWTEKYPDWKEMRRYFENVDDKLNLSKDIEFGVWVRAAQFDENLAQWKLKTDGRNTSEPVYTKFFIICAGHCTKPYIPAFEGLSKFRGVCHHTARWPQDGLSFENSRVGIIGTGASGIQVAQEAAKTAIHLSIFQRTPAMCVPMQQETLDDKSNKLLRETFPNALYERAQNFAGGDRKLVTIAKKTMEVSKQERERTYEQLWALGGFYFWLANYEDLLTDPKANRCAYNFWRNKVKKRVSDPEVAELLAPRTAPHPFGTRRVPLEQNYYEVFNQENVSLFDIKKTPIERFSETSLEIAGKTHELDIIVLATGFDALTGCITTMDIRGITGQSVAEKWETGVLTYHGIASSGFPNLFFSYGPQSPTAFSNGPTQAEYQGDHLVECLNYLRKNDIRRIEAKECAEISWARTCNQLAEETLFPLADGWYMGSNIPGKKKEMLCYTGGLPNYLKALEKSRILGFSDYNLE